MNFVESSILNSGRNRLYFPIDGRGVPINDITSKLFKMFPSLKAAVDRNKKKRQIGSVEEYTGFFGDVTICLVVTLYDEERGDNVHHLTTVAVRLLAHFQGLLTNTSVAVATLTTNVAGRVVETNILEGIFKGLDITIDYHWS